MQLLKYIIPAAVPASLIPATNPSHENILYTMRYNATA